uniref:aralkylamine N-acetyltransferase n=1 Tax=Stomoxys calcitrans TaxID=35570 RepID=A0A1I8PZ48_STOCA
MERDSEAKPLNHDNLEIRIIQTKDVDKAVNFLMEYFFPNTPLSVAENKPTAENALEIRQCIETYGCSIMALEGDEIVGVCTASPKTRASIEEYFVEADKLGKTNRYGQILRLVGEVNRGAAIFDHYGVENILCLYQAAVAPSHGGRNIATRMTQELMRLAKNWNYQVLSMDCSCHYSARVCERLGMECLNTIAYDTYRNDSGEVIFKPPFPHVAMKTYAKRL